MLEVLQTYPSQWKYILSTFGTMDHSNNHMILFYVDKLEHPHLPSFIPFQLLVSIKIAIVQWCIIDEDTFTYVMFTSVWNNLVSMTCHHTLSLFVFGMVTPRIPLVYMETSPSMLLERQS